jgi:hypothetical protein
LQAETAAGHHFFERHEPPSTRNSLPVCASKAARNSYRR